MRARGVLMYAVHTKSTVADLLGGAAWETGSSCENIVQHVPLIKLTYLPRASGGQDVHHDETDTSRSSFIIASNSLRIAGTGGD